MIDRFRRLFRLLNWLSGIERRADMFDLPFRSEYKHPKVLIGTLLSQGNLARTPSELRDVEFQVFSQFGDDGIIQYLTDGLPAAERTFVEFGVENYTESNTRFLLVKDKWSGLVLDGRQSNIDYIRQDLISTFFNLRAEQAFITAENIDDLLRANGMAGKIGLLSIDIDGLDYWVWRAMTVAQPAVVVVEYNAAFGPDRSIVVPYAADFVREKAHPSRIYWGASLKAFENLASEKGYRFVGCNGNGNNAYFVLESRLAAGRTASLRPTFQPASFGEFEVDGRRLRGDAALAVIRGMSVINTQTSQTETL
jgi:hypothetical protein